MTEIQNPKEQNSKTEPQVQHPLFLPSETFFYFIGTIIPSLDSSITPLLQLGRSPYLVFFHLINQGLATDSQ
jgi:hypothetical protein